MSRMSARKVFSCRVESYRRQDIPNSSGSKVSTAYIPASEIVEKLDLDEWMDVNPRVPKRSSKGVLSGHVVNGIFDTLSDCPEDFALKNLGMFILVESVEHDRASNSLTFALSDKESHGLCNGGHTYAALRAFADRVDADDKLSQAFVRVQLFEQVKPSKVVSIAEGLNRSRQVDDASLDDLRKNFDIIKDAMKGKPGAEEIGYHMGDVNGDGDPCAYYIPEIVRYLMFFNCARYNSSRHPHDLYRYQKRTMDLFREDVEGSMKMVCQNAPKILRVWHDICHALPDAQSGTRRYRRMEVQPRGKDGKAKTAGSFKTTLHFIDHEVDCAILNGWVMPMVAAFRANVRWNLEDGLFEWKIDPEEIIPHVIGDFYRICAEAHDNGRKPDEVGRDGSIYSQMYDKVDQFLIRRELDQARERLQQLESSTSGF